MHEYELHCIRSRFRFSFHDTTLRHPISPVPTQLEVEIYSTRTNPHHPRNSKQMQNDHHSKDIEEYQHEDQQDLDFFLRLPKNCCCCCSLPHPFVQSLYREDARSMPSHHSNHLSSRTPRYVPTLSRSHHLDSRTRRQDQDEP